MALAAKDGYAHWLFFRADIFVVKVAVALAH